MQPQTPSTVVSESLARLTASQDAAKKATAAVSEEVAKQRQAQQGTQARP